MASPNSTFTEMVTSTLREHPTMIADNMGNHNALLRRIYKKGNYQTIDGGYEIIENIEYADNATVQRYSGYDQLDVSQSEVLSAAKYDWKLMACNVVASGQEIRMNSGKNAMFNLVKAKIKNAEKSMANALSNDIYSDGTSYGGKQIGGLEALVTQAGTGTVGGIVSGTYTWWKNQFKDGAGATKATIGDKMRELWLLTERGSDQTDFIVSSDDLYTLYWNGLTDLQRFTSMNDKAGDGFASGLKFMDADVFRDSSDSGASTTSMYFLNTDYLKLKVHKDANMKQVGEKSSFNQDAVTIPIIFQGNLCLSNRARQGILFD